MRIPCYRTNEAPTWSAHLGRPITGREKLASMGYPTYPHLAYYSGCPEWVFDSTELMAQARRRCGNSMHLGNLALICMAALLSHA